MESHLSSSNLATASNGGSSSDPSKESGKVWERPWSITELREGSKNWTLASDAGVSPPFCLHIHVHVHLHVHCIRTYDILLGPSQYEQFIKNFLLTTPSILILQLNLYIIKGCSLLYNAILKTQLF